MLSLAACAMMYCCLLGAAGRLLADGRDSKKVPTASTRSLFRIRLISSFHGRSQAQSLQRAPAAVSQFSLKAAISSKPGNRRVL